jgi:hypothetical protein
MALKRLARQLLCPRAGNFGSAQIAWLEVSVAGADADAAGEEVERLPRV